MRYMHAHTHTHIRIRAQMRPCSGMQCHLRMDVTHAYSLPCVVGRPPPGRPLRPLSRPSWGLETKVCVYKSTHPPFAFLSFSFLPTCLHASLPLSLPPLPFLILPLSLPLPFSIIRSLRLPSFFVVLLVTHTHARASFTIHPHTRTYGHEHAYTNT